MPHPVPAAVMSAGLRWLLATSCGLIVANIYYAQPLAGPISASLGLSRHAAGLIVTLTQIGYGLGLLLVVPLGDIVENRRLVVGLIGSAALALAAAAAATGAAAAHLVKDGEARVGFAAFGGTGGPLGGNDPLQAVGVAVNFG